jgi:hypothetical protein
LYTYIVANIESRIVKAVNARPEGLGYTELRQQFETEDRNLFNYHVLQALREGRIQIDSGRYRSVAVKDRNRA